MAHEGSVCKRARLPVYILVLINTSPYFWNRLLMVSAKTSYPQILKTGRFLMALLDHINERVSCTRKNMGPGEKSRDRPVAWCKSHSFLYLAAVKSSIMEPHDARIRGRTIKLHKLCGLTRFSHQVS